MEITDMPSHGKRRRISSTSLDRRMHVYHGHASVKYLDASRRLESARIAPRNKRRMNPEYCKNTINIMYSVTR
jgi:hypothetical protein